jgi:hypothetical protein
VSTQAILENHFSGFMYSNTVLKIGNIPQLTSDCGIQNTQAKVVTCQALLYCTGKLGLVPGNMSPLQNQHLRFFEGTFLNIFTIKWTGLTPTYIHPFSSSSPLGQCISLLVPALPVQILSNDDYSPP